MDSQSVVVQDVQILPIVKHYCERLDLYSLFDESVEKDPRDKFPIPQVLCVMVSNLLCGNKPLYHLVEWFRPFCDGKDAPAEAAEIFNDDRCGRALDRLFHADRKTMLTQLSLRAIEEFELQVDRIHNDTTTVTFHGEYDQPDPEAVLIKHGYNKDHRPDLKQIVFGLNTTADHHVPLSFNLYNGNTTDDGTHLPNWQGLRDLLGKEDFVYVADRKLCCHENLETLDRWNGRFITVMPRSWSEYGAFVNRLEDGEAIPWKHADRVESSRRKDEWNVFRTFESKTSDDRFRLIWVHSSQKAEKERTSRLNKITKAESKLSKLTDKLNRYNLKDPDAIRAAAEDIVKGFQSFMTLEIKAHHEVVRKQIGRGRPGPDTLYREETVTTYSLSWARNEEAIERAELSDGVFPLITNTELEPVEVLGCYRDQPYLENRFHNLKGVLEVAPVFLRCPHRIEAMMFLYWTALMIMSLMEREIRQNMEKESIESLPLRPNRMKVKRPTFKVLRDYFCQIFRIVDADCSVVRGLTTLHRQVLKLLSVPDCAYTNLSQRWWNFRPG